jgi:hypothetical protein
MNNKSDVSERSSEYSRRAFIEENARNIYDFLKFFDIHEDRDRMFILNSLSQLGEAGVEREILENVWKLLWGKEK